jgi:hypothetical protein
MRRIASLRGRIYELVELAPEEVAAIVRANGYDTAERFIDRHANWQSSITPNLCIHDSTPVRPPKFKGKPAIQKILNQKRGRPAKIKNNAPAAKKTRRKRKSKYGFEKIKEKGSFIFVEGEAYKVAAAAAYFGGRYNPPRKYSVHKAELGGIKGSRVEWVQ